jgi:hypothetical protein
MLCELRVKMKYERGSKRPQCCCPARQSDAPGFAKASVKA